MTDEHQRYERLAVGHVVGGLDEVDAARFRSHLVACRDCRSTVAELRGIASDLVATERDERAGARGRTELAERVEEEAPPRAHDLAPVRDWPWRVVAVGLVPLVLLGVLAWAVWVRAENNVLAVTVRTQAVVLETIAEGDVLGTTFAAGVTGVIAVDEGVLGIDLGGVPAPAADEVVEVAVLDAEGAALRTGGRFTTSQVPDGRVLDAVTLPSGDEAGVATTVVVRLVRLGGVGTGDGLELARAALPTG